MKKLSILLTFALLLSVAFIFTSCDQETVDSTRSELKDICVDLLSPILKEATETTASSTTSSATTDTSYLTPGTTDSSTTPGTTDSSK